MTLKNNYLAVRITKKASCVNIKKIGYGALVACASAMISQSSLASLYIYPVKGTGTLNSGDSPGKSQAKYVSHTDLGHRYVLPSDENETQLKSAEYVSQIYANISKDSRPLSDSTVNSTVNPAHRLPCYGKDVPLEIAIGHIYDGVEMINYQEDLNGKRLSWSSDECNSKEELLSEIQSRNNIRIHRNDEYVGITSGRVDPYYYAHLSPLVWRTDPTKSITENLTEWGASAGWEVVWPSHIDKYDFEAPRTTIYGDLKGDGGVFDRVLSQMSSRDSSMTFNAAFYNNGFIVIEQSGFKIEHGEKR